ncbi:hypothetical protein ACEQ8H_001427 [Pleosporales sp. CAS-2024a]
MTHSNPLILYDISSPLQPRSYAPNPSKARLALGFKQVPFTSTFVEIPDIPKVRSGLDCAATRKLGDGSDFYTLPMLRDAAADKTIGDSFDIAHYLEDTFPECGGCLFPKDSTGNGLDYESPSMGKTWGPPITTNEGSKHAAYARFNLHVDTTFTAHVMLVAYHMPFNRETAEATKAVFLKRANLKSWDDMMLEGEAREQVKKSFQESLTSLAQLFMVHAGGPFLEGEKANYADLIVGGWVNMMAQTMPEDEWRDFRTWHGGVWARLHDALQVYFVCK